MSSTEATTGTEQSDALAEARKQLAALIEAAKVGNIIPRQLPGQLEAIAEQLAQAEAQAAEALKAARANSGAGSDGGNDEKATAEFWKVAIHELRTPMTSIRGYGDMLNNTSMAGPLSEMQSQLLAVMRANSRRMEGLLADMSHLNKLRAGIVHVSSKMDMFSNIGMMLKKKAQPLAEELGRQIEFEIPQGLPLLEIDAELLVVALMKLIENGLRYSPEVTGKVIVRAEADGKMLVIHIEDNGIGMKPEELARLGEIYFRSDNELVRSYKGSGLGVAIAYGLIDVLGGTHSVTSQHGAGTQFVVRLPGMS
jgi:signal transduction histidine kinase